LSNFRFTYEMYSVGFQHHIMNNLPTYKANDHVKGEQRNTKRYKT